MSGNVINFQDKKINKKDFYNNEKEFKIKDIDLNKILISEPESYGNNNAKKYIIGYNDNTIRPLHISLPKMNGYIKYFKHNKKTMSFLANNENFFKKYIKVWEKTRDLIGKKFDSEPVYSDKYIKTKIKSYNNNRTNFRGENNSRKIPKETYSYICLSIISLDAVIKMNKQ